MRRYRSPRVRQVATVLLAFSDHPALSSPASSICPHLLPEDADLTIGEWVARRQRELAWIDRLMFTEPDARAFAAVYRSRVEAMQHAKAITALTISVVPRDPHIITGVAMSLLAHIEAIADAVANAVNDGR